LPWTISGATYSSVPTKEFDFVDDVEDPVVDDDVVEVTDWRGDGIGGLFASDLSWIIVKSGAELDLRLHENHDFTKRGW